MIKSFKSFNEAKTEAFYFMESDEYNELVSKYKLSDDVIREYFIEILDEGFELKSSTKATKLGDFSTLEEGRFEVILSLQFDKDYPNPIDRKNLVKRSGVDVYLQFLQDQIDCIQLATRLSSRLEQAEDYESMILGTNVQQVPFWGAGNNTKDYAGLSFTLTFKRTILTNEYDVARNEYENEKTPGKNLLTDVIRELVLAGIPKKDARKLVDLHPGHEEMEDIIFGFLTNDQIRVIAHYNKKLKKLSFNEDEVALALNDYETGYCSEYL